MEERLVTEAGLAFRPLAAAPIVGRGPMALVRNAAVMLMGILDAWRLLGRERPDIVFVTGGYVSVPLACAAWLRRVPLAIYLPDATPGQAVRWLSHMADRIFVTAGSALGLLPSKKTVVTGYPVREALRLASRDQARLRLNARPDEPVILVVGGSQGSRRLNQAVLSVAPQLLERAMVIHATGPQDIAELERARAALPQQQAARWRLSVFLSGPAMAEALAAADLVVGRAGAACLGELPARGVPAILVPLAIAGGHQAQNAALLEAAGGALVLPDAECDGPRLLDLILDLLADPLRLATMGRNMRAMDQPEAARRIGEELLALAAGGKRRDD